jgi:hypothetical protein
LYLINIARFKPPLTSDISISGSLVSLVRILLFSSTIFSEKSNSACDEGDNKNIRTNTDKNNLDFLINGFFLKKNLENESNIIKISPNILVDKFIIILKKSYLFTNLFIQAKIILF